MRDVPILGGQDNDVPDDHEIVTVNFAQAVAIAAEIGSMAAVLDLHLLDRVIANAEQALESGVIDPMTFGVDAPTLRQQLEYMRAFRTYRAALEPFFIVQDRPA